jgi:hypothetical protein
MNYTSYAVAMQTERLTRWKPDPPAAAWYMLIFLTKILHKVQNFCQKDGFFRPAGGKIPVLVRNRVTRVT